jgi:hypothetical protein
MSEMNELVRAFILSIGVNVNKPKRERGPCVQSRACTRVLARAYSAHVGGKRTSQ